MSSILIMIVILAITFLCLKPKYKKMNLDKNSEEYKIAKKTFKRFNFMLMLLYVFEIIGIFWIFYATCACGYPFVNPLAVYIFMMFQFATSLILYNKNENKGKSFFLLLIYDVISIILFLAVIENFPNNHRKRSTTILK